MATKDQIPLLRDEHRGIMRHLGLVGRSLNAPGTGPREDFRESVSELGSRLEVHFACEERVLYAPLSARLKGRSPTEELLNDHQGIREVFNSLNKMEAEGASVSDLREQVFLLWFALKEHLGKEERVLFWLADSRL